MTPTSPIGVFDSGLGGLTVLKALHARFPEESYIYLGDTARLPYGNKSPVTILNYVKKSLEFFSRSQVKAVVVACNSASSVLGDLPKQTFPVYGVIEPGAASAAKATPSGRIGVLGTRATVAQQAYVHALKRIRADFNVYQQACPLLVPLVEEGWDEDPITNLVLYRYLQQVLDKGVDTLILGCTHYPMLKPAIQRVTGRGIHLVDSAEAMAEHIAAEFSCQRLAKAPTGTRGALRIFTSDHNEVFSQIAQRFLGEGLVHHLEQVDL